MNEQGQGETLVNPVDTTVIVSRSVSKPVKDVWKALVTREGAEALLGPGGELGDKGDSWRAVDGTYGVVRSYHPLEQIRFSWHAAQEAPKTMVEIGLAANGDATLVEITHHGIPRYFDAVALTQKWELALDRVASAAD